MNRTRRALVAGASVLVLAGLGGGYVAANVADRVPGPFTTAEPWPEADPFPTPAPLAPAPVPLVLPDINASAAIPTTAGLQPALDALRAAPDVGTPAGVVVIDVASGETLIGADADLVRTPASTTKMLTAAAAITTLDLDSTLPTTTVLAGANELYLVGGGDMDLAAGAGDPAAVRGRAGLGDLAAATAADLASRGITSVTLRVDDSLFSGPGRPASGWEDSYFYRGFVAPIQPLAVNIGLIEGRLQRDTDPAMGAATTFAAALTAAGITVEQGPSRGIAPADAAPIARVESAPLRDVLDLAMVESSNTLTEVFGRLVAIGRGQEPTFEGATTAVLEAVASLGVDVSGTVLTDTSGLSLSNRISPRLLAELAALSVSDPAMRPLLISLPVSGLEGTLLERGIAPGLVRAKTGTLLRVVSLAGVTTTADGRLVAFSVMADGVPAGGAYLARLEVDEWVNSLTSFTAAG